MTIEKGQTVSVGSTGGLGGSAPTVPEDALRITTLDGKYTVILPTRGACTHCAMASRGETASETA